MQYPYGMLKEHPPIRRWRRNGKWTWVVIGDDGDEVATGRWADSQSAAYDEFRELFPTMDMSPIAMTWM